jgi:hypothetical protein
VPKAKFFNDELFLNIIVDNKEDLEIQIITFFKTIEKKEILNEL